MSDYKNRLKEEHAQLEERVSKLNSFILKYYMGEIKVELDCPLWLLELQLNAMNTYLTVLKKRIEIEGE
jgi:hypothetical protein